MRRTTLRLLSTVIFSCFVILFLGASGISAKTKVSITAGPEPKSLDAALHPAGSLDVMIQRHLYDGLTFQETDGTIKPALATSWKFLNPTTVVFRLRKGVKFHDETSFTASAVKLNLERTIAHKRSRLNRFIKMIKSVRVIDDFTVEIKLKYPFAPILANLTHPVANFVSPAAIKKYGKKLRRNPVGTGAFIFKEWVGGEFIRFEANPNYWGGKPAIDELVYRVVPEATTRVLQLRAGQIQLGCFLPPSQQADITNDPKLVLVKASLFRSIFIGMNSQLKPFNNPLVRQAVNYAVDTKTIVNKVMLGIGKPIQGPFGPNVWGYDPAFEKMGYGYNPQKAKELLKKAGYPNGFETVFWHPSGRYTADKVAAEAIQAYLAKVGIRANLRTGSWGLVAPTIRKGKAPIYFYGWGTTTGDADMAMYFKFHSSMWGRSGNYSRYKNPKVDKLLEEGRKELDSAKRKAIYLKAAKQVTEDAPWIFFKQEMMLCGKSKKLKGVIFHPSQSLFLHKAKMAP